MEHCPGCKCKKPEESLEEVTIPIYPSDKEEAIKDLLELEFDCASDDWQDFLADAIENGHKGLRQLTDEELRQEWEDWHDLN